MSSVEGTVDKLELQSGLPDRARQALTDRSTLVIKLREQLPAALKDEPVQLVYLYGSQVTGQTTPLSDVDVALVVGSAIDPLARLKLILRVQLTVADRCGIEHADVQVIDDAPLVFRVRVVSEGIPVYSRDERERVAFEVQTRMRYFDYLPIHRELQASFFRDIRERGLHG
jgi:predicted nucleotidyltransferase